MERKETQLEKMFRERQIFREWMEHCSKIKYPIPSDEKISEFRKYLRRYN